MAEPFLLTLTTFCKMKNRKQCIQDTEDQTYEDMEGEENEESCSCSTLLYDGNTCPICLNCLLEQEIGFPENCSHTFCMTCILKWAEIKASCPVDRRPFQAVCRLDALDKLIKVQVTKQLRRKEEEENCACNKETYSRVKMRSFVRRAVCPDRGPVTIKLSRIVKKKYSNILHDKQNKKAFSVKINKVGSDKETFPRRQTCWNERIRTNFFSTLLAGGSSEESFFSCRNDCTEFTEINSGIRQKRQELELSCSSLIARVESVPLISYGAEAETFLLTSSAVAGRVLPTNIRPLENFGKLFFCKGYAVACTQEGEEKKEASGSSGTRGSRRKSVATTPTRRSARNSKNEALTQSRSSPRSSSSACSAPESSNPSLNKTHSEAENTPPKRRSKRAVKQQAPAVKKKLRSSAHSEKSPCGSVEDDDIAEPEVVLTLDKDHQSDNESNNASLPQKNNVETESANGLESCSEHAETEETTGECDRDEYTSGNADVSFSLQELPILTLGSESQEFKVKDVTENKADLGSQDNCENTLEEVETVASPKDDVCDHATSEKVDQTSCSPQKELMENTETLTKVDEPIASPENELLEHLEPLGKDQPLESPGSELPEHPETMETDNSETELKPVVDCANTKPVQDEEPDALIHSISVDSTSEQPLKEDTISESEEGGASESSPVNAEHKHFGEDNNEMIPMDCDSFCSDQNELKIEQLVPPESTEQGEVNSVQCDVGNCVSGSDEKDETVPQARECQPELKTEKKARTRRSRFHSPSTTWSPSGREGRKSQSPSPKRETTGDRSSQSPKKVIVKEGRRSLSCSPKRETLRDEKKPPSRSPKRETVRESRRSSSRSRTKDSSPRRKSRSRSSDRDNQRRDRDRERRNRKWSRSQSRSRSRSRSRTRNKGSSFTRNERESHSPRWKERWGNDSWRSPRGNDRYRRSDQEKQNENLKKEKDNITEKSNDDQCSSDKQRNDCPDWVMERINSVPEVRNREREKPHWEEGRHDNGGQSWNKNFGSSWIPNRGRGQRGRGGHGRSGFMYGDQSESHWQNRKPLSGNSDGSGSEASRFSEQQPCKRKNEQEYSFDTPADRSGWTSASSWAVRKTLPADVQNYYSRRGRNSSSPQSGWGMRQEEETPEQDPNLKDQGNQQNDGSQLPINMMQQQMNVMPQVNAQHQPMNIFPYPVGVHPPLMNMQRNPFNIHPAMPMHLPTGVPLIQVAAPTNISQGLPPPPPPPPPSQQVNYIASQQDGKQLQGIPNASHVSNSMSAPALPAPAAVLGNVGTVQGPNSGNATSSGHMKSSNAAVKLGENKGSVTVEASADSSKKDQKLLIQEKAAQEVKLAIKPFYQNKDITKEEYKEIVRKAVDKVCHSKSGEVNSAKVANLVKAYVDKYKHSRKKNPEEAVSCERK
ncbi:protein SCAF11 isoform X3 [Onychostruthus taczanowskii]|uniref:protein SCAF11 isoform X3 n=1 Tax=Onychostruthus taczanowskii TaxID=356909 RepID=UPI001B808034|nr:protein SCAF11 isoform X3 [Onychostruthus taczanowskii]XP_041267126.1 protein SCAF11 isoform X3 [Onychostruthus taczanowskii]